MKKMFTHKLVTVFLLLIAGPIGLFAQQKPNIVFILADDLGYGDLGCYGSKFIKTPNIDFLAKKGLRFTNFYAGSTVCAPSRATLMTGLHTGHAYIRGNGEVPLREHDTILPQYLQQAGYRNGMAGKWGLGQAKTTGAPEKKGWDFFSGLLHHVEGHYQMPDSGWQLINGQSSRVKIPANTYANQWFKNEAIRFIQENQDHPFFLYLSFTLPHAELVVPNQFLQQYLKKDGQSKFSPEIAHRSQQHYGYQQYPKAAYAAMVTQMDTYVGEVYAALKRLGLLENTLIIFTSDNGTHTEGGRTMKDVSLLNSTAGLRGIKRDLYEGGIRVPFVAYQQNRIEGGLSINTAFAMWDLLPTLCAAAGSASQAKLDGISFYPTLLKQPQKEHDYLYWEFYEGGFKQAIRMGNWKAIRFYNGDKPIKTELYRLDNDPKEANNLAELHVERKLELEHQMNLSRENSVHPLFALKKGKE